MGKFREVVTDEELALLQSALKLYMPVSSQVIKKMQKIVCIINLILLSLDAKCGTAQGTRPY